MGHYGSEWQFILVFMVGEGLIVTFYSDDLAVQILAASLLLIVCMSHFLDGLMTLLTSLLRCWDVSILPMLIF